MQKSALFAAALLMTRLARGAVAGEPMPEDPSSGEPFNLVAPTMGGKQVWTDELLFRDYRIQRNAFTGHCRLLDGRKYRLAWGSYDQCSAKLDRIRTDGKLDAAGQRVVIVLHGLFRNHSSVSKLGEYLADEGKYTVYSFGYATTRNDVESHARKLALVLGRLEGAETIDIVAHSLGNLVVRRYLALTADPNSGVLPDARLRRFVMVGAPNNGAQFARLAKGVPAFELVTGRAGQDLTTQWESLEKDLAIPSGEFGIIAGGKGDGRGYNPILKGDDDMVVRVEETKLPGARDFTVLPVLHSLMMTDQSVMEHALRFLEHGHFVSEESRAPLTPPAVK